MRRALLVALVALAVAAPAASAHPLGNFSVNHLTQVSVAKDRVDLRYILDQAEIPTFQERGTPPAKVLARKKAEILRTLVLEADGRRVELRERPGAAISFPRGQGGLRLTRIELPLTASVHLPTRLTLHDGSFAGRVGWKAIVARPGAGADVRSDAPSGDPTHGLRRYPAGMLSSPLDERDASFTAEPGDGALVAPKAPGASATTTDRSGDGFTAVFDDAAAGEGVLLLLLLTAFGWGAVHALSPGHGKAMVAAYLVGTRGTPRHALALGATVTVTHTAGVFALGLVTLLLSQYVLPEQLYPWLNLVSGLLVVGIGASVLRARLKKRAHAHHHDHEAHHQSHSHGPAGATHPHGPAGAVHSHGTAGAVHSHGPFGAAHSHGPAEGRQGWKGILAAGAAAGLIPCPSALVVLLAAVSQHQIALGLLLIVAFSLGLAGTLTGLGVLVVSAKRLTARIDVSGRAVAVLPAASALVICGVGCLLTLHALQALP
jgi:nickel/cobalt transporter (NicO) family protein